MHGETQNMSLSAESMKEQIIVLGSGVIGLWCLFGVRTKDIRFRFDESHPTL